MSHASIWVGWDPREAEAFAVCRHSLQRHSGNVPIHAIALDDLRDAGLYRRPTSVRDGRMWDDISEAPCSTQFAISRFMTPLLAKRGWAVFMDCDILCRADMNELFDQLDDRYAVMCVKHHHVPPEGVKMDNQLQTLYRRKNWSSVMAFRCEDPRNQALTVDLINTVPGRELHAMCWLRDEDIGALDPAWNWLEGYSDPSIDPKLCHFSRGGPWFAGYEDVAYAEEWRAERGAWLHGWHRVTPRAQRANGVIEAIV